MSSTAAQPLPGRSAPQWGAGRVLALVGGSLLALVAVALALAGVLLVLAHVTARDSAGFYTSPTERFATDTYALTSEDIQIGDVRGHGADGVLDALNATVRVRASAPEGGSLFIGIARTTNVDRYLSESAHAEVTGTHAAPFGYDAVRYRGTTAPAIPTTQGFWAASASGDGTQALTWEPEAGHWSVVVMNADGSPPVTADVSVGAKTGAVLPVGIVLLALGAVGLAGAAGLLWIGAHDAGAPAATAVTTVDDKAFPLRFDARAGEPLSRWLWLVKWLLAIPHAIVLGFLWVAYAVLTLVALVAIVFTGRYPRAIFDFNVGVLRWTWRVVAYAGAFVTDRYPPFTLAATDYPAELDVPYPQRLSRAKACFKPWLLSLPHWLVVAVFLGWWTSDVLPGLLPLLALIGGVALLFTGRYPRDISGLVTGMARWIARVAVYAGLMRDEYPPFRLYR